MSVLRIPEVSLKIEEAQRAWDKYCRSQFSIQHFLCSENSSFFNNINLKSLALSVVQLGLYERYRRLFGTPEIVVGAADSDSPLRVVTGEMSLPELVSKSPACGLARPLAPLQLASELVLNGRALPQFQALRLESKEIEGLAHPLVQATGLGTKGMNLMALIRGLLENENISRIVNVGPGLMQKAEELESLLPNDVQVIESIDADPMLNWFWPGLGRAEGPLFEAQ